MSSLKDAIIAAKLVGTSGGGGLSDAVKQAILQLAQNVVYSDPDAQECYNALHDAFYPPEGLQSISATYTQSGTVYDSDSLDSLKTDLVVTATYTGGTTETVSASDYSLSGTLTVGTSSITVLYGDKTATFDVVVSSKIPSAYTEYEYIYAPTQASTQPTTALIYLKEYDDLNVLSTEFAFKPVSGHYDGGAIWGRRTANGYTSSYAFYAHTSALGWHMHGAEASSSALRPATVEGSVNIVKYTNTAASPSKINVNDGTDVSITWNNNNVINAAPIVLANPTPGQTPNVLAKIEVGYIKFFDLSGNLVGHYVPVVREADNVIGMFEIVEQAFYTASDLTKTTLGGSGCIYNVGNW